MSREGVMEKINNLSPFDDRIFQKIICAVIDNGFFTERTLADLLMVSRSTISRWRNGVNLPHDSLRVPIFEVISERL